MGLISGVCLGSNLGLLQIFVTGSIFSLVMILVGVPVELVLIAWLLDGFSKNAKYAPVAVAATADELDGDAHVIVMQEANLVATKQ